METQRNRQVKDLIHRTARSALWKLKDAGRAILDVIPLEDTSAFVRRKLHESDIAGVLEHIRRAPGFFIDVVGEMLSDKEERVRISASIVLRYAAEWYGSQILFTEAKEALQRAADNLSEHSSVRSNARDALEAPYNGIYARF